MFPRMLLRLNAQPGDKLLSDGMGVGWESRCSYSAADQRLTVCQRFGIQPARGTAAAAGACPWPCHILASCPRSAWVKLAAVQTACLCRGAHAVLCTLLLLISLHMFSMIRACTHGMCKQAWWIATIFSDVSHARSVGLLCGWVWSNFRNYASMCSFAATVYVLMSTVNLFIHKVLTWDGKIHYWLPCIVTRQGRTGSSSRPWLSRQTGPIRHQQWSNWEL